MTLKRGAKCKELFECESCHEFLQETVGFGILELFDVVLDALFQKTGVR
jgi:hypothetical protein